MIYMYVVYTLSCAHFQPGDLACKQFVYLESYPVLLDYYFAIFVCYANLFTTACGGSNSVDLDNR